MIHCVYHNDPDGWCSAAVIRHAFDALDINFIRMNYGFHFPWSKIKEGDSVYMVDFTLQPFEDMIKLNNMCNLVWIDHHISSIRQEDDHPREMFRDGIREVGRAGCELTWEYLKGKDEPTPYIVRMIGRYDVWDLSFKPDAWQVMLGLKCFDDMDNPDNPFWQNLINSNALALTLRQKGEVVEAYQRTHNRETCDRRAFPCKIDGVPTIACNSAHSNSTLFDSVWDPEKYDMMCTFGQLRNGRWSASLYSTGKEDVVDCSVIAMKYGGGGHAGAAGFTVSSYDELPFELEELNNE